MSVCKLCLNKATLRRSHAIPNSIFRELFRKANGKAVHLINDKTTPVGYTNDSLASEQLCDSCEKNYLKIMRVIHYLF